MPLKVTGELTSTIVEHTGAALPAGVTVPSKREAVEALGVIQRLAPCHDHSVLIDGEVITWEAAVEIIRRFILTR